MTAAEAVAARSTGARTARRGRRGTLAERLGHRRDARLLIVNADDFGSAPGANAAIVEGFARGTITSTTLMVPCPWAAQAARLARKTARRAAIPVGVHLTVTSEWQDYRWGPLTGADVLRARDGRMHRTMDAVVRAVRRTGDSGLRAIRGECAAQIDQALRWRLDVTHLDAHMGVLQLDPALAEIYLGLADEYGLPVRMVPASLQRGLGFDVTPIAAASGIVHPDHFLFTYLDARPVIERAVASLRPGVTEILLHPAADSPDLRAGFPDADERVANRSFALDDDGLADLVDRHGVTLIGYRELRDLMRSERS